MSFKINPCKSPDGENYTTITECRREYDRGYRAKNREKIRARDRASYRKNREKRLEMVSKYYQKNRKRILAYKKRRAMEKRQNRSTFFL